MVDQDIETKRLQWILDKNVVTADTRKNGIGYIDEKKMNDALKALTLADRIFVMSARPGRIVAESTVDLPRPRTLDMTYEPQTMSLVRDLRENISAAGVVN